MNLICKWCHRDARTHLHSQLPHITLQRRGKIEQKEKNHNNNHISTKRLLTGSSLLTILLLQVFCQHQLQPPSRQVGITITTLCTINNSLFAIMQWLNTAITPIVRVGRHWVYKSRDSDVYAFNCTHVKDAIYSSKLFPIQNNKEENSFMSVCH